MSAAESEESRWPDLATASIRTQSIRRTVAQRSSSCVVGTGLPSPCDRGGGLRSGTGLRCLIASRLPAASIDENVGRSADVELRPGPRSLRAPSSAPGFVAQAFPINAVGRAACDGPPDLPRLVPGPCRPLPRKRPAPPCTRPCSPLWLYLGGRRWLGIPRARRSVGRIRKTAYRFPPAARSTPEQDRTPGPARLSTSSAGSRRHNPALAAGSRQGHPPNIAPNIATSGGEATARA